MNKHGLYIALASMAAAYFVVVLIALALFWPQRTFIVNNYSEDKPIPVAEKVLHPGEPLTYELDYCKYKDSQPTVKRQLIDGQIITLQDTVGNLPTGCHVIVVKTVVIPETINPGRYYLDVKVDYPINPLRDNFIGPTRTHYRTEYFDVEAPVQKANAIIYGQPTTIYVQPQPNRNSTTDPQDSVILKQP